MPPTNMICTAQLSVNPTVQQLSEFRKELRKVLGSEKYDLTCKADAAGAVHLKISYRLTDEPKAPAVDPWYYDEKHTVAMMNAIHTIDPYCVVWVNPSDATAEPPAPAGSGEGKLE